MQVLNWLYLHHDKVYEPERWAALLGIKIIDPDGWRGSKKSPAKDFFEPIDLREFLQRCSPSTVQPLNINNDREAGVY